MIQNLPQQEFIHRIVNGSGIHFDPLGSLKVINDYFSVIIPVDISYFNEHIENINSVFGTTRFLCKESEQINEGKCHNMLEPLSVRFNDIKGEYQSISNLISKGSKRSAWFAGVGSVFKHIFGTMDENDAIKLNNAISSIDNKEKKMLYLIKDNILLTTATLSEYNKTIHKMKLNDNILNNELDKLALSLKNISTATNAFIVKNRISSIFNVLESSLMTLSFKLEDIVNAIMFSKNNVLHPSIITPSQLYDELVTNSRNLINNNEFPIPLNLANIYIIMNLSETITYLLDNKIIFVLKIPLVNPTEFRLYKNIPIPVPLDVREPKSYSLVIPTNRYIAISDDRRLYCSLEDTNVCKIIMNNYYICNPSINMYSTETSPNCESDIISKLLDSLPKNCESKFLHGHINIWQKLNGNKWIYVQSENTRISIDCFNSTLREINILGTGILSLPINCKAYSRDMILYGKSNPKIKVNVIKSNFNLINDTCCNNVMFNAIQSNIPHVKLNNVDLNSLRDLESPKELIKKLEQIIDVPLIQYNSNYPIITIVLCILVISYIIYLCYKCNSINIFKGKNGTIVSDSHGLSHSHPQLNINTDNNPPDIDSKSNSPIPLPRIRST